VIRSPLPWLGGLIGLYLAIPLLGFVVRLARSQDPGFGSPGLFPALFVSIESATISLAFITVLGVPLAYLLARTRGRIASFVGLVVMLPLALPPLMSGILLIYLVGPYTLLGRAFDGRLTMSLAGLVLAQTFCAAPFLIVSARTAFGTVDQSMLDVAATLGHGEFSRFLRVALPIAAPGIRAGMLLAWLRAFGEYGAVIVLAYHPFSLPVYTYNQFSGTGLPTTIAPTALALGVAVIVVGVSRLTLSRRPSHQEVPAPPTELPATQRAPVSFDLELLLGTFRLALTHQGNGDHLAILGPSGSGKTALLRALAGLYGEAPGPVRYGARSVADIPVEERHVGYVAQGFTLFPHLTVWQQLLFGRESTPHGASYWLHHLRLQGLENRYPSELSGGQRQRVSLAQALCCSPDLLLLDEPFSALDAPVRQELRRVFRRLQRESGVATVLVTHDPEEAAFLSDEVIVLANGKALQSGATRHTFDRPASPEVARLLGIPNLHRGVVTSEGWLTADGLKIAVESSDIRTGSAVLWSIRPERVGLLASSGLVGTLVDVADVGTAIDLTISLSPHLEIQARTTRPFPMVDGDTCHVVMPVEAITLWPAD
jgi:molybdate transport system permease protein